MRCHQCAPAFSRLPSSTGRPNIDLSDVAGDDGLGPADSSQNIFICSGVVFGPRRE